MAQLGHELVLTWDAVIVDVALYDVLQQQFHDIFVFKNPIKVYQRLLNRCGRCVVINLAA